MRVNKGEASQLNRLNITNTSYFFGNMEKVWLELMINEKREINHE